MDATLETRFQQFLRERKYLRNVRPQTIEWYETAWHSFKKSATSCPTCPADLGQCHLGDGIRRAIIIDEIHGRMSRMSPCDPPFSIARRLDSPNICARPQAISAWRL